ncbi:MAG TPA: hypothetical protein VGJ16_02225, partial [Pirellulales bacterium]
LSGTFVHHTQCNDRAKITLGSPAHRAKQGETSSVVKARSKIYNYGAAAMQPTSHIERGFLPG